MTTFVSEKIIEELLERIKEDQIFYEEIIAQIIEEQPAIASYLNQTNYNLLKSDEFEYMWFLSVIIFQSSVENQLLLPEQIIEKEDIENIEDTNWSILNNTTKGNFYDRLTPFYKNYFQEDLLSFIEDSLTPDEATDISEVGAEIMFIALKTVLDSIVQKSTFS